MRIIVGCEESQIITQAFRDLGHEAYSCDLIPTSGKHPEWHFQEDIIEVMKREKFDLGIFHPPCTYLTISANKWYADMPKRLSGVLVGQERLKARELAVEFFMKIVNLDCPHIAIENPVGIMSTRYRKPNQVIQPWMFGHGETKATCLWLKGLPPLIATDIVEPQYVVYNSKKKGSSKYPMGRAGKTKMPMLWKAGPSPTRSKERSKTFPGIAKAMAEQWGRVV